jgi:hypothetical protein
MAGLSFPRRPRKAGKGFGNALRNITDDARKAAIQGLRTAARDVLNDLVEVGPAYSGKFQSNWYVESDTGGKGRVSTPGPRGWGLQAIPLISQQEARRGRTTLYIGNSTPYATVAMDLEPGKFIRPDFEPLKTPVAQGRRVGRFRGDVTSGEGNAISTAERDWFVNYMDGGAFTRAFNRGAKAGFIEFRNRARR